jgi:hypothetical protein
MPLEHKGIRVLNIINYTDGHVKEIEKLSTQAFCSCTHSLSEDREY